MGPPPKIIRIVSPHKESAKPRSQLGSKVEVCAGVWKFEMGQRNSPARINRYVSIGSPHEQQLCRFEINLCNLELLLGWLRHGIIS